MNTARVLLIGLDGVCFEILDHLRAKGRVKHLAGMIRAGTSGPLRSTPSPLSPQAWASLVTGVNAGKHGVYDFVGFKNGTYEKTIISNALGCKSLWRLLKESGKKTIVINLPIIFPPSEADGIMVSGMMAPNSGSDFTYPGDLKKEILTISPDYLPEPEQIWSFESRADYLKHIFSVTRARIKAAKHILTTHEWDFFMVVFTGPDRLQHFFQDVIDPRHPDFREGVEQEEEVLDYFDLLDSAIKEMIEAADNPDTLVVSDHGFEPLLKNVYVNDWLVQNGYLKMKSARQFYQKLLRRPRIFNVLLKFYTVMRRLKLTPNFNAQPKLSFLKSLIPQGFGSTFDLASNVDWENTKAFVISSGGTSIRFNLKGREPEGIVPPGDYESLADKLTAELKNLKDNGKPVIRNIWKAREIFDGDYINDAPDLIIQTYPGYAIQGFGSGSAIIDNPDYSKKYRTGEHSEYGIFIAKGPRIKSATRLSTISILDIAPTVLALFGREIPSYIDGRVMEEAIIIQDGIKTSEESLRGQKRKDYAPDSQVVERLSALGYLD